MEFIGVDKWWRISLLLCLYGFFKEYRPSEPFISPFLTGPWKNFTSEQVNQEIYPAGIYFNLSLSVLIFLLTDFLRYKPVLIIGGFAGIITWTTLIVGRTIPVLQVTEFFYGLFMASEVAYYTYIYAKVHKNHYQKVTSHTRSAFLLGKAGAGLSSQLFVHFEIFDYLELNYLTVCALVITTIISIFLPPVSQSVYFHRYAAAVSSTNESPLDKVEKDKENVSRRYSWSKVREAFIYLYDDFKDAYANLYVVEWSIWWALATCFYLQVASFSQLLWEEINETDDADLYNGLVEFASSLLGASASFGVGYVTISWRRWGELVLGILTIIQAACVYFASYLSNLYIAYVIHIGYGIIYHVAITIASSEVAKCIRDDSFALIFGINGFVALLLQSILTALVINYLQLGLRLQVYGYCLFVTGCVYLIITMYVFGKSKKIW